MLPSFANETVTRLRPGAITERNSIFRDWTTATSKNIDGCHVQPDSTSSDFSDRANSILTWTLWAPVDADVQKGDRIIAQGRTFDVVGVPYRWYSPRNAVDHMTCRMTEWEG